jgi:hypothetical protein
MDSWSVRVEIRGVTPAGLTPAVREAVEVDLAHITPRISIDRDRVVVDVVVIAAEADLAVAYATERLTQALTNAGLSASNATIIDVSSEPRTTDR